MWNMRVTKQLVNTHLGFALVTLDILIVPSDDLMNRTGDFEFSFIEEVARFRASGGISPSGNSKGVSSPLKTILYNSIVYHSITGLYKKIIRR